MVKILTVIPARGGSKSIPRKNIKIFQGFPLIKYSIDYSLKSKLIEKTIVSTEDREIADISKKYGAEVPFLRSIENAGDEVQDFPVIKEALIKSELNYQMIFDLLILLRPTSPLRPKGLIEKGISLMQENLKATSLRSVTVASEHPYRQWYKENNFIRGFFEDNLQKETYNLPRQKLIKSYFQSGDIEIIRRNTILSGSISGDKVIPLEINKYEVNDIDNEIDFINAEKKFDK